MKNLLQKSFLVAAICVVTLLLQPSSAADAPMCHRYSDGGTNVFYLEMILGERHFDRKYLLVKIASAGNILLRSHWDGHKEPTSWHLMIGDIAENRALRIKTDQMLRESDPSISKCSEKDLDLIKSLHHTPV